MTLNQLKAPKDPYDSNLIILPQKVKELYSKPRGYYAFRCMYSGRGGAKSMSAALMAAAWGAVEPLTILCVRQFQNSIQESFFAELVRAIRSRAVLYDNYEIGEKYIKGRNGTQFIFKGLHRNPDSVRSVSNVDLTIFEEAEDATERVWSVLIPSIFRTPKAECWVLWNPRTRGSPTDKRFRGEHIPARTEVLELSYRDNPFFPAELEEQRLNDFRRDPQLYAHVWEGEYLENSERQVFSNKWKLEEFTPQKGWDGPYQGLDFGFDPDPLAAVRAWRHNDRIYVEHEAFGTRVGNEAVAGFIEQRIPGFAKYVTRADSADSRTINYLSGRGLPSIRPVKKGAGSVREGIRWLRGHDKIVVHPRCTELAREFRLYSHKVNDAGDVLPDIADGYDHGIDALRYAMQPLIGGRPLRTGTVKGLIN